MNDALKKRNIKLNHAVTVVILLCCLDMTVTYFALQRDMQKYPTTWREKELSFTVGPMLRFYQLDIIPALIFGAIANSLLYTTVLRKIKTEFVYGLMIGAIMLAALSNARIALMT